MTLVCDVCGKKGARIRKVTRSFGRGKTAFLIERVPVVTCGESYLTSSTLRTIERIRRHRRQLTKGRVVQVAKFA